MKHPSVPGSPGDVPPQRLIDLSAPRVRRWLGGAWHLVALLLLPLAASAAEPLTTLDYKISGQVMQVTPASLAVPKGIPGSIGVSIPGEVPSGSYVEATLRGPSFPARRLVGQPNAPLLLPPLNLVGDYSLDGIRLVSNTGETLLEGAPASVPVRVFDEVLVSRVTSRPLSLDEISDRGIEIDDLNFRAVEFEVAFVVDGKSFPVKFPVIAPSFRQTTEIIPAAELEARLVQAELLNQQLSEAVGLPKALETVMPQFQVKGINMEFGGGGGGDDGLALSIPPIPALMVIPGNIGFLNQFFSVQIFTENAAPAGSGLSVHSLTAELILPPGPDLAAGTFTNPGDDPLRFVRVNGAVQNIVPVRAAGPDGKTGTSDDIDRLQAGDTGQGELLVEGLQEGLHVMDLKLSAKLEGLAAGAVTITGKAAGSILVRNPKFSMAFTHPRTVRFGEPYEAVVTILNTSGTVANLVSVELNANNVSGGLLESPGRVELASIAPGETKSATFRIRSQKTGAITFSNLTTSDDSVIGRFRLKTGVDERGVALSPDSLIMPEFLELLPAGVINAAQRVLGQALSTNTAGQLPPGVLRVSKRMIGTTTTVNPDTGKVTRSGGGAMVMALLEAAQRLRFGEPLGRVLPDLLLDWQGAREFDPGWDQLIRETDAGREWREALMLAMEQAAPGPGHAVARLVARNRDFAGRGESWLMAASDRDNIDLSYRGASGKTADSARSAVAKTAGYGGADGDWLVAAERGVVVWKMAAPLTGEGQFSVALIRADGTARELLWRIGDLPAGACVIYDANGGTELAGVDANGDGTPERTVVAQGTDFTELPPEVLVVRQDPEVLVGRPSKPCPNPSTTNDLGETVGIQNYANVVGVLFSKPMTQATADVPAAYRLENGNEAGYVQMQPGGRIALLTMKAPLGAIIPRSLAVSSDVKDARGNAVVGTARLVQSFLTEGVNVRGRVIRADGSFAANVPVTLTYNDSMESGFGDCEKWIRRVAQVRTDATGAFDFDFVIGGIPYSLSATDTSGLSDEAIDLILGTTVNGQVNAAKLEELAALPQNQNTLLAEFAAGAMPEAIAKAEGLDRALVDDLASPGRFMSESFYALRFRGRGAVTGQVVLADGTTPVPGAAANLFPDVNSRELGRGILTDSAGRFAFFGVPLGPFTIEALTPTGLTRTVSGVLLETAATVNLVVSVGATPPTYADWQGRLTEPDGTPVAGGPVYVGNFVRGGGFAVSGRTVTDASGYWSMPQIPVGSYTALGFSLDGKRKGTRGPLTSVDGVITTANIVLQARATVEGVVQFANGDPVAGAVVGGGEALVTTDSLGRFTLDGVPTGSSQEISGGIVGDETSADPRKHLTRMASVRVNVQAGDNFAVLRFASQGRIVGQLLDEAGVPVPHETVALPFPFADQPFFLWVRSDERGFYEFPGLGLGGPIGGAYDVSSPSPPVSEVFDGEAEASKLVGASADEVAAILGKALAAFTGVNNLLLTGGGVFKPTNWGFTKGVRLDFDGETEVANIRYARKSNLSGTVKNGQRVPIGARVRLTGIGPNGVGFPTFVTRAEKNSDPALGTFEFIGEAFVGDWGLQAASPFFPTVVATAGRTTSLAPNVSGVVLQFPPVQEINGSLTGQILLSDGTPAGANVEVRVAAGNDDPRVLRTDADGRFTTGAALFSLRGNTSYQITVFDPATGGKAQDSAFVQAAQDNRITLTLLGRGTAEIFVKKADGTPAAGAAVEIQGGRFPQEHATGVADGDGRIVFSNLFQGPYAVIASATIGLTRVAGRAGVVVPLDATAMATVTLAATATVTGTFVASNGVTPITFANVRLGSFAYAPTDANGRFSFVDVPLGVHVLTAVDQVTGRGGNTTVALSLTNETREVRIVETSLGTISGLVLNAQGTGTVPNAEIELQVDDAFALTRSFKVTSGPDGAYSIAGVAAGSFTVTAVGRLPNGNLSGDRGSVRATLPVGISSLMVDVPFAPRAGIVVKVFELDGTTPAANAAVNLFSEHFLIRTLDADAQGQVTFGNLALSNYAVVAVSRTPGQTRNRSNPGFVTLSDRGQEAQASVTLRGAGSVRGVVVQADGTTPAPGAEVKLEVKSAIISYPNGQGVFADPVAAFSESVVVGADGAFSFPNLPVGLPLLLTAKLLGLAASETVAAVVADQTTTRNLMLTASGTVVGRVLREDGTTLAAGTDVVVEFPSRSGLQGAILQIVGADGRFSLAPVPQGNWSVKATDTAHNGLAFRSGDIAVNAEADDLGDIILDESFPTVTATTPADTTEGVDINTIVEVVFSEPLEPGSINTTGVFVRPATGGAAIPATLSQPAPNVVRLDPTAPLASETTYQIVVVDGELRNAVNVITNRGPKDRVGRSLLSLFSATFTTRDQRPPQVLSFTPGGGAVQVDPRTPLRLSFDEPIQPGAVFTLTGPAGPIPGTTTLGVNNLVLTFVPAVELPVNAILTASVSGVRDLAGNAALAQPLTSMFATLDTLGPVISQLRIKNGLTPTAGANITLEAVLATAESGVSFRLSANAVTVGSAAVDRLEVPFTLPQAGTIVFRGIASDRFGNEGPLAELSVSVFPNTPPVITLTRLSPFTGPVATGSTVSVRLSAADDSGITELKATMTGAATAALKTTTGAAITLVGVVKSTAGAADAITILAQATDTSGVGTGEQTFTLPIRDGTAPTLALDGAVSTGGFAPGAVVNIPVRGRDNFGVTRYTLAASGAVTGTAEILVDPAATNDPRTLTFTLPGVAPVTGAAFTVTIRAEDAAGLSSAPLAINLRTADQTPPQITAFSPAHNAVNQSTRPVLTITANEALDPATVTPENVRLVRTADSSIIPATVALNAAGTAITLTPVALPLAVNTAYRLVATAGLTDVSGNALTADAAATFTTADFRLSAPLAGLQVVEGQPLTITAVSGFGFPTQVRFSLNGVADGADMLSPPFQRTVTVPVLAAVPGGLLELLVEARNESATLLFAAVTSTVLVRGAADDSDTDGLTNGQELAAGSDPFRADADEDPDSDGLTNAQEIAAGTKANDADTDDDFLNDGAELTATTNPLDPDTDDDLLPDGRESLFGANPKLADTDGDTLGDGFEVGFGRYFVVNGSFTYDLASVDAASRGGHLLTVVSAKEQTAIETVLGAALTTGDKWIGYSDSFLEGAFRWVTGELAGFQRFGSGEPNNVGNEDAVGIRSSGLWNDFPANTNLPYFLELGFFTDPTLPDTDGDGVRDDLDDFIGTPNAAPVAVADAFFANAGETVTLEIATDLLGDDSDPNGDPLAFLAFTQPAAGGTVTQPNNSTLVFTPAADFSGTAAFAYTIVDAGGLTSSASVSITVGTNTRPVAGFSRLVASNHALRFDGIDDFVQSALTSAQSLAGGPWTIEAWVKPEAFNNKGFPTIYSQGFWRASLGLNATTGKFDSWVNNTGQLNSTVIPPLSDWTHVAVTFDGTTRRFIVDGVEAGAVASSAMTSDNNPVYLGAAGSSAPDSRSFFQGTMDEVRVWKRALSAAEIAANRHDTLLGTEPGLAAYWPFEEGAGTTTADATGQSAATLGTTAATAPEWVVSDAPVAGFRQDETAVPNTQLLIRLEGSDADGNALTGKILSLPANGRLFQFAGGVAGPEITVAGTPVSDVQRRVIFEPNPDFAGADGFRFSVSDGGLESFPARLAVAVLGAFVPVADDVWDASAGVVVTASSPMATTAAGAFDGTGTAATFADGQPAGFTHFLEWKTPTPVEITAAQLFADDDGPVSAAHGFSALRLFGRMTAAEPFTLLATYRPAANPYFGELRAEVAVATFIGTEFRAEFDAAVVGSGPRVAELDAIGETVVMVPAAAGIVLQNATASNSQGGFPVGQLIDGITTGSSGWAGDVGGTPAMTAVFESQQNLGVTASSVFTFTLPQTFGGSHFVGCFRLSATTADRSTFADGLAVGGDVTANWTVLQVVEVTSTGGETLAVLADGSVLVTGNMPATTSYTVRANGISGAVTGFRLELLEHPALPNNGPGRVGHGNWVLTELLVSYNGGVPNPNRAPRGTPDAAETLQGIPLAINPLGNDSDPDGDPMTLASFEQPPAGTGSVAANGVNGLTYTPTTGFVGTTSFTYRATDGFQAGKPTLVTLTVRPSAERRWINPAGGNWSVAANWLNGLIPGADEVAVIEVPGTYTVNVDVNATVSQLRLGTDPGTQTLSPNSSRALTVLNGGTGGAGGGLAAQRGHPVSRGQLGDSRGVNRWRHTRRQRNLHRRRELCLDRRHHHRHRQLGHRALGDRHDQRFLQQIPRRRPPTGQ